MIFGLCKRRMSPYGYEQTLSAPRREVCLPPESGRACREIRKPRVLGLVTAQKRTSHAASANVS